MNSSLKNKKDVSKQVYHSNATTNVRLRNEINNSNGTYLEISEKFGVSVNTVKKWKNREEFKYKISKPKAIYYSLSELEILIAIGLSVKFHEVVAPQQLREI